MDKAFYGPTLTRHDGVVGVLFCFVLFWGFLSPAGWAQTGFSLLAHRNFYCKLLHIITFYSSGVSWWDRRPDSESPNGFAHEFLLMHVIRSYMSQWALNHEATSGFSVVVNNDANESIKCRLWGLRKDLLNKKQKKKPKEQGHSACAAIDALLPNYQICCLLNEIYW